jgi:2-phospho-L-lactate guanylyltransferase
VLAIIPVNRPTGAKRRLAGLLDEEQRATLVRAMLEDVVGACRAARQIERVLVVTPEPSLAPAGVDVLPDPGRGHRAAVALGLARAVDAALVVMGDCPLVQAEAIDRLALAARPVAIGPASDGGTNALALRPPNAVEPAFGEAGGARIVAARARALGYEPALIEDAGFALDIDTPADIERLLATGAGTRTHALLDSLAASALRRA